MKGLEQAVNIKLWPGNGEPVKAWGKLKRVRESRDSHPRDDLRSHECITVEANS